MGKELLSVILSFFFFWNEGRDAHFNQCILLPPPIHVPPLTLPSCQPSQIQNAEGEEVLRKSHLVISVLSTCLLHLTQPSYANMPVRRYTSLFICQVGKFRCWTLSISSYFVLEMEGGCVQEAPAECLLNEPKAFLHIPGNYRHLKT